MYAARSGAGAGDRENRRNDVGAITLFPSRAATASSGGEGGTRAAIGPARITRPVIGPRFLIRPTLPIILIRFTAADR